jgi:transcription antitermination factor NusG
MELDAFEGNLAGSSKDLMHTGDPFHGMNVRIVNGSLKQHSGMVLGTILVDEKQFKVTVRVDSQTVKTIVDLDGDDVLELM